MLLFLFSASCLPALTADASASLKEGESYGFSLAPLASLVYGHSNELVFDSSSDPYPYMSRLNWQIRPAVVLGVKGSFNLKDMFFVNGAFGTAVNRGRGIMTDHDWLSEYFDAVDTEWTHESVSDIYYTSSFLLDSNAGYRFLSRKALKMNGMLGFKYMKWGWTDSITSITYPGQDLDYLIGVNGIDYTIQYRIPYLGISGMMEKDLFRGGLTFLYSFLVSADDHDHHILRSLHFYDSFKKGQYFGLSASAAWHWHEHFALSLAYDFDYIPEITGNTTVYNDSGSYLGTFEDGAGVSYAASSVTIALEYHY